MIDGEGEREQSLDEILNSSLGEAYDAAASLEDGATDTPAAVTTGQTRDDHGRFAARQDGSDATGQAAQAAPGTTDQGPAHGDGAAAITPPSDAPASWSAEAKAHWKTLPPALQAELARREADFSKGIDQKAQGLKAYEALETVIGPRRAGLSAEYGSVENAVSTLFKLSDFASQDKPGFVRWFMNAHGLDPQQIFGGAPAGAGHAPEPGNDGGHQPHVAPEIAAVQAQVENLKADLVEMVVAPIRAKARTELEAFEADPKNVHFKAVRKDMEQILLRGPEDQTYEQAYEAACWAHPEIRKQMIEAERKTALEAQAKEAAEAAKNARRAAGPQLRSVGTPGEFRAAPASIDQTLSDAWERSQGAA